MRVEKIGLSAWATRPTIIAFDQHTSINIDNGRSIRNKVRSCGAGDLMAALRDEKHVDARGVDPGTVYRGIHRMGGQHIGHGRVERAAMRLADGRASGRNDRGFAHGRHQRIPGSFCLRSAYLPNSSRAMARLCTSSGPSAKRRVRMLAHICASTVSCDTPAPP